jgi:hypothetical protein
MTTELLDFAEHILAADETVIVPVKKLWVKLQQEGSRSVPPLDEFTALLRMDERFEFMLEGREIEEDDLYEGWTPDEIAAHEQTMEELGFFRGPRVKLARIELTRELLFGLMARSLENMSKALKGAWETRPEGEEVEDQLGEIWEKHLELKEAIEEVFADEPQDQEPHGSNQDVREDVKRET